MIVLQMQPKTIYSFSWAWRSNIYKNGAFSWDSREPLTENLSL